MRGRLDWRCLSLGRPGRGAVSLVESDSGLPIHEIGCVDPEAFATCEAVTGELVSY